MLVCLYRPAVQDNSLIVTIMPSVQQRGSADCGLFAIGTAFQAASGLSCDLKQGELSQQLKENFNTGILTPFLTTTSGKKTHIIITLYCVCLSQPSMTPWWCNVSSVTRGITIGVYILNVNPFVHSVHRIVLDFFFTCICIFYWFFSFVHFLQLLVALPVYAPLWILSSIWLQLHVHIREGFHFFQRWVSSNPGGHRQEWLGSFIPRNIWQGGH